MNKISVRAALCLVLALVAADVAAQPLGTFSWQLQPYCNVLTVSVTQDGALYTLDGYDTQCGAGQRASAVGMAFFNPNGTVGIGVTIVAAPGGLPVHVDATISPVTLSGTWHDSIGNTGPFVFTTSTAGSGPVRPAPPTAPTHEAGSASTGVGIGTLEALTNGTANTAVGFRALDETTTGNFNTAMGSNALGGNTVGASNTAVGYLALGETTTGESNTAVGAAALSSNLIADFNTAVGARALDDNTTGEENTAVGRNALALSTEGDGNTALGARALDSNLTGNRNTGVGIGVLQANTTGDSNVAIGAGALSGVTTGSENVGIGLGAGALVTTGSDNVYIRGAAAATSESNTIRIGGVDQDRAFIAGIRGVTTGQNNAVAVVVDSSGQLGTVSSSRRVKEDIAALGGVGRKLQHLRPVRFRYAQPFADGSKPVQYGLIAEEVAAVLPELVAWGADGEPETVLYHVLPSLLIEEVQRLQRELDELRDAMQTSTAREHGGRR